MRCSVLQCVAVCCSVLQCVAVCCKDTLTHQRDMHPFSNTQRAVYNEKKKKETHPYTNETYSHQKETCTPPPTPLPMSHGDFETVKRGIYNRKRDIFTPKRDVFTPKRDVFTPKRDVFTPKRDVFTPKRDMHTDVAR